MGKRAGVLRKEPKHAALVREIMAQIRSGTLVPGDRLPAITELTARYGLSQRAAVAAIRTLVAQGLVCAKHRSGCYVAEGALEWTAQPQPGEPPAAPAVVSAQHLPLFLVPRARKRPLSIYVTDILPECVARWRTAMAAFRETHPDVEVEMVSCTEGHLEDVLERRHVDVVQTTPAVLENIGRERFLNHADLTSIRHDTSAWLPIVRERIEKGEELHGVPFSVTVRYLYVNLALAREVGIPENEPGSVEEWVARAREFEVRNKREGAHGCTTAGLQDDLIHSGAVHCEADGTVRFDARKAEACLQLFAKARFTPVTCMDGIPLFLRGQLLYLRHCSFTALEFQRQANFPWAAYPVPMARGAKDPGFLIALAVHRKTSCPHDCLELVRHLTSRDVQRRFGEALGNLPARADAVFDAEALTRSGLSGQRLRTALNRSTLCWPEQTRMDIFERLNSVGPLDALLTKGEMTVAEAVERLRCALAGLSAEARSTSTGRNGPRRPPPVAVERR